MGTEVKDSCCTVLLSVMGFVFLTYTSKPLTPGSQPIVSTIRICSTFGTETSTANAISLSLNLILSAIGLSSSPSWIFGWKLSLWNTIAPHLLNSPTLCRTHRVQSHKGLWVLSIFHGKSFSVIGSTPACANIRMGGFHFTLEEAADWAAKLPVPLRGQSQNPSSLSCEDFPQSPQSVRRKAAKELLRVATASPAPSTRDMAATKVVAIHSLHWRDCTLLITRLISLTFS